MLKLAQIFLCLSLFLMSAFAEHHEELNQNVYQFIELLIRIDEPSLTEYEKFSGECGGESELIFLLEECRSKGWDIYSKSCIEFTRQRCYMADQETSLRLSWLRNRFSTSGKDYRIVSVQSKVDGISFELIVVEIGNNKFLLFHNTHPNTPTGLLVGVSEVNGKRISEYLK